MNILDVLICCSFVLHVTSGQLTQTPINVATKVGQSVSLACAGVLPKWGEFITAVTGNEQEIASGANGGDLFDNTKYQLTTEPDGNYELTIRSPGLRDGGRFRCTSRKKADSYGDAEVIVFESDPTCTTNATDNKAVEGDYVMYSCEVKYQGRWAPVMEWKNTAGIIQATDETSGNTVKYTYVTEVKPANNGQIYTCRTYFDQPKPGTVIDKGATNKPSTDNVFTKYTSAQLIVYYGPRMLVVEPVKESYYPEDNIKITTDSNPSTRTYEWLNTATNETLGTSDTMTVTAAMLGSQTLKVLVCNTIPVSPAKTICKELLMNFTVMMTTTSTTTSTTTTPSSSTNAAVPPSGESSTTPDAATTTSTTTSTTTTPSSSTNAAVPPSGESSTTPDAGSSRSDKSNPAVTKCDRDSTAAIVGGVLGVLLCIAVPVIAFLVVKVRRLQTATDGTTMTNALAMTSAGHQSTVATSQPAKAAAHDDTYQGLYHTVPEVRQNGGEYEVVRTGDETRGGLNELPYANTRQYENS